MRTFVFDRLYAADCSFRILAQPGTRGDSGHLCGGRPTVWQRLQPKTARARPNRQQAGKHEAGARATPMLATLFFIPSSLHPTTSRLHQPGAPQHSVRLASHSTSIVSIHSLHSTKSRLPGLPAFVRCTGRVRHHSTPAEIHSVFIQQFGLRTAVSNPSHHGLMVSAPNRPVPNRPLYSEVIRAI